VGLGAANTVCTMLSHMPDDGGSLVVLNSDDYSKVTVLEDVPDALLNAYGLARLLVGVLSLPRPRLVQPCFLVLVQYRPPKYLTKGH
jgi:hypothetical protein